MNERKAGHDSKKMPSSGHLIKNAYTWFLEHGSGNKVERQLEQMFSQSCHRKFHLSVTCTLLQRGQIKTCVKVPDTKILQV